MIKITHNALQWFLTQKKTTEQNFLLLGLRKSGCSGFSYHLYWATKPKDGYQEIMFDDPLPFRIFYDSRYESELNGTILDFEQKGFQRQLIWKNPNVTQTCGCGESIGFNAS